MSLKHIIKGMIRTFGYEIVPARPPISLRELNPDVNDEEWNIFELVMPYTMTSLERTLASIRAAAYVSEHGLPGDIVECGVWRGGSSMAIAQTLLNLGDVSRALYLYDTFEGMTEPSSSDLTRDGWPAAELLSVSKRMDDKNKSSIWAFASLEDVQKNMDLVGYPREQMFFVKGPVEETIPGIIPERIALLRLDTDWYESTKHELVHLYPRLVPGGVLMIDDYGHWRGAQKATDEYFSGSLVFLSRIDYTGRLAIKNVTSDKKHLPGSA
jgi:O-methyltransferase